MSRPFVIAMSLTALVACGKKQDDAPAAAPPSGPVLSSEAAKALATAGFDPALDAKAIAMMTQLDAAFAANPEDCDALARAITKVAEANRGAIDELTAADRKQTPEQRKVFDDVHAREVESLRSKMMPAVQRCGSNRALSAALVLLQGSSAR